MNSTYQVLKSGYHLKPERVADALIEIIENMGNPDLLKGGSHKELVKSLDSCINMTSKPDCTLDIVEQIIEVFIKESEALSIISNKLDKALDKSGCEEIKLARAYIQEVYLSSRGIEIDAEK